MEGSQVGRASAVGAMYLSEGRGQVQAASRMIEVAHISTPFLYSMYLLSGMKSFKAVSNVQTETTALDSLSQQIKPPVRPNSVLTTGILSSPPGLTASPCPHTTLSAAVGCSFRCRDRSTPLGENRRFVHHNVCPTKLRSTTPIDRYWTDWRQVVAPQDMISVYTHDFFGLGNGAQLSKSLVLSTVLHIRIPSKPIFVKCIRWDLHRALSYSNRYSAFSCEYLAPSIPLRKDCTIFDPRRSDCRC